MSDLTSRALEWAAKIVAPIQTAIADLIKYETDNLYTKLNELLLRADVLEQQVSKFEAVSVPDGVLQFVLKIPGIIDETAKSLISKIDDVRKTVGGLSARVAELEAWRTRQERVSPPPQGGCPPRPPRSPITPPPQKLRGVVIDDPLDEITFAQREEGGPQQ